MINTNMSFETLLSILIQYRLGVYIALVILPLAIFGMSFFHGVYDGREAPWRHTYAFMVHVLTALFAAVGALTVYHILESGSSVVGRDVVTVVAAFAASWLLVLLVVKRAVDFSMLLSVRNPFVLFTSWAVGWAAAWTVDQYAVLPFSAPRVAVLAITACIVFLVIRVILSIAFKVRS